MRNSSLFLLIVFLMAIATAYAISQEAPANTPAPAGTITTNDPLAVVPANQVQVEIEKAVSHEPSLSGDHIEIKVSDDTIEISGKVNSGKEKLAAERLAESFARNRRVKDLMTVANRSTSQASSAPTPQKHLQSGKNTSENTNALLNQTGAVAQTQR